MNALQAIHDKNIRDLYRVSVKNPNKPKGGSFYRVYATPEELTQKADLFSYLVWECETRKSSQKSKRAISSALELLKKQPNFPKDYKQSPRRGEAEYGERQPREFRAMVDALLTKLDSGWNLGECLPELAQLGA